MNNRWTAQNRRPRARSALALLASGALAATGLGLGLGTGTAHAAETLGASAAQSGRYFGVAIDPGYFNDQQYVTTLNREFNSVVAENAMKWEAT